MTLPEAIIGGIVQGATEFLPVSSSGHLAILHGIFGMSSPEESITFDILLHLATLVTVFIVYAKDIFELIPAFFRMVGKLFTGRAKEFTPTERFALALVIATLPLAAALFLNDYAEMITSNIKIIGAILIFNGIVLLISDKVGKRNKSAGELTCGNAVVIGLFQLAAITPGLSRSGSTITGGLICGLRREDAVKFSFILSIPAIIGANITKIDDFIANPVSGGDILNYGIGMVFAAVTGFAALKLLSYIANKKSFGIFSYYCFGVGLSAIIFG